MDHVILYVSLVMAVAPMVAMLYFIWWVDRYDREPLRFVLAAFLWGGFGAIGLSIIASTFSINLFQEAIYTAYDAGLDAGAVVVAPVVEEFMKGLIVFFLLRYRNFDNVTDGLVYGAASGLGFGMTENFLYFTQYAGYDPGYEWLSLIFIRSMLTANMHCAASATFGAGISKLKEHGVKAVMYVLGSYILAVLLHSSWNYLVTTGSAEGWGSAVLLLIVYVVIIFIIFVFGIRGERKQRESVLGEEFDLGVLPEDYKKILMSYGAMKKSGWFPEYLNKEKFLMLVSRLSLRKTSYYKSSGKRREKLHAEIVEVRRELQEFTELVARVSKDNKNA